MTVGDYIFGVGENKLELPPSLEPRRVALLPNYMDVRNAAVNPVRGGNKGVMETTWGTLR